MPELPDITIYVERIAALTVGQVTERVTITNPFVLRSVDPPLSALTGCRVVSVARLGKRVVIGFEGDLFVVIHLMIAGRLRWITTGKGPGGKSVLGCFVFGRGTLYLTEAGTQRRASIHVVRGREALGGFDRGGLEALACTADAFAARLRSENHTLKRALTDPCLFSGIGNAYSDEILHRARLSPLLLTSRMSDDDVDRLFDATRLVLVEWTDRLRRAVGDGFPEKVTAFRPEMAVHGRFGQPCPVCAAPVQRIRYAQSETNYCARCQTGGRLLADRAMSRLLKGGWPRTLDD